MVLGCAAVFVVNKVSPFAGFTHPTFANELKETKNTFDLVLIGDENSGKSAILRQIKDGKFKSMYIPTIGSDIFQQ
jgi:GTPase SAR1 family protein